MKVLLASPAHGEPLPPLTLPQAVETALRSHPQLAGYRQEFRAAEGRLLQASLLPNPALSVDVENVWGDLPGSSRAETTYGISQLLELGKRSPRIRKAESESEVIRRDFEITRLNVIADVKRAFINVLSAGKKLELNREAHRLAMLLADAVSERVSVGAVSPIEETRAKVALAFSSTDLERTAREAATSRLELAAAMGESEPSFDSVSGELDEDYGVPAADNIAKLIATSPDVTRWGAESERRAAVVSAERSLSIPDVTLKGGLKRIADTSETTFVIGFAVPLPLFHRNQGAIREAEAHRAKAETERKGTEVLLTSRMGQLRATLAATSREARILRNDALFGAQSAYDAVSEGYRFGKFRYLDVLDAGKALIETRLRYLDALTAMNLARTDLERLLATNQGASR
jgi:cobalt-zinc-cadmium efflux system outer membrane protein